MPARAARPCYAAPQRAAAPNMQTVSADSQRRFCYVLAVRKKRSAISSTRKQPTVTDELLLYANPMSRGRIVRRMPEETGLPCPVELLDDTSAMKAPAYLAVNPLGKVPAIPTTAPS